MTVIKSERKATITRGLTKKRVAFIPNNGGVSISIAGPRGGHQGTIWIDDDDFIEAAAYIAAKITLERGQK